MSERRPPAKPAAGPAKGDPGPILNGPYDEPQFHFATGTDGHLDYRDPRPGRRVFAPDTPQVPLASPPQSELYDLNELAANYRDHLVNLLRDQLGRWRAEGYPGVTSRVTRELLSHWFNNPERAEHHRLFFAQREAVEAAIWLNEVADKSNPGTHVLNLLARAQATSGDPELTLPRIAFKMATGTGKTVVMACLVLYHYLNRQTYGQDPRYADYFLLVAPGVTIRDRLGVLRVDTQTLADHDAADYYRQRKLVPPAYAPLMAGLNARLVITNFHGFEPRLIGGNKKSPLDGKLGPDGRKVEAREDEAGVLRRLLPGFKAGRRLLVLNDEAHHCYLPKAKGRDGDDENSATENERAAVWYSGLCAVAKVAGEAGASQYTWIEEKSGSRRNLGASAFSEDLETLQGFEPLPPEALATAHARPADTQRFSDRVFEHLKHAGIKNGLKNETAVFNRVDAINEQMGDGGALHAEGWYEARKDGAVSERKAYFHIGPQFGTVSKKAVNDAILACRRRADADWLVILGFGFESDVDNRSVTVKLGSFEVTKVRMHDDLMQDGLIKKDKKAASFVTIGEPDIATVPAKLPDGNPGVAVEIRGLDLYDPITDEVKPRNVADIAYWMVDEHYDGSNFVATQVFFCGGDHDEFDKWKKGLSALALADTKAKVEKTLKLELDDEAFERVYGHRSHPIAARKGQRVAVRVISQFGEESTKVLTL